MVNKICKSETNIYCFVPKQFFDVEGLCEKKVVHKPDCRFPFLLQRVLKTHRFDLTETFQTLS